MNDNQLLVITFNFSMANVEKGQRLFYEDRLGSMVFAVLILPELKRKLHNSFINKKGKGL